jgi:hypothetical protein
MKQTKPFGRAYIPAAEVASASGKNDSAPTPTPESGSGTGAGEASGHADLFSLSGGAVLAQPPKPAPSWRQKARECGVLALVLMALLTVYVLMRDSVALANLLQQVTTEETVMVCKDGKMIYPDYSIVDRLLGNGRFLCTEWSVQRGFLTLPRH